MSDGEQVQIRVTAPAAAGPRIDRRAVAAASVTVVLWASAFVAIRSGGRYFDPGALALGRLLAGSLVLAVVWLARGEGWPPRAAWPGIACTGVLWFGVYMVALNWGEQHVDAGTAAMIVNIGPVIIAILMPRRCRSPRSAVLPGRWPRCRSRASWCRRSPTHRWARR